MNECAKLLRVCNIGSCEATKEKERRRIIDVNAMNNRRWVSRVTNAGDGLQSSGLRAGRREFEILLLRREKTPRKNGVPPPRRNSRRSLCSAQVFITRTNGDRAACACIDARITVHNAQERGDNANE